MKRTIIVSAILLLIVTLSILSLLSIYNNRNYMFSQLDKIQTSISNNDIETAFKQTENLDIYWENKSQTLATYIKHNNLEKSSEHLALLLKAIELKELNRAILEIENVKFYIDAIYKAELPTLRNVL